MNKRRENKKESGVSFTWPGILSKLESISTNPAHFLMKHASLLLLIAFLGLTYIWINNKAQSTYLEMQTLERELEELKWEYTSRRAEFMYKSKQTEVAEKSEKIGLKELTKPAMKVDVVTNEH